VKTLHTETWNEQNPKQAVLHQKAHNVARCGELEFRQKKYSDLSELKNKTGAYGSDFIIG
jgi:hypothetical protein